ncbi:MAG: hypothetical protein RR288_00015 [Oscillibacter sp.]
MTQTEKFAGKLSAFLKAQQAKGVPYVDLTAGDLGRLLGVFNKTPLCVAAMKQVAGKFKAQVLHDVPNGTGISFEIRYYLS